MCLAIIEKEKWLDTLIKLLPGIEKKLKRQGIPFFRKTRSSREFGRSGDEYGISDYSRFESQIKPEGNPSFILSDGVLNETKIKTRKSKEKKGRKKA